MNRKQEIEASILLASQSLSPMLNDFCMKVKEARNDFDSLMKALEKITNKRDLTQGNHEKTIPLT